MGAYKQFLTSDIIIAPLEVHKGFYLTLHESDIIYYTSDGKGGVIPVDIGIPVFSEESRPTYPGVGIDRLLGKNIVSSLFSPSTDLRTGFFQLPVPPLGPPLRSQYQRLVYNSIKELYYSNYLHKEYGDPANRRVLIPGRDEEGNRYIGSASSQAHYDNYLQTTLTYPRFIPTASDARIGVITIPNVLFGDYIQPNSFYYAFDSGSTTFEFIDDGEGNLRMLNNYYGTSSAIVGNVIYPHGIITLTGNSTIYDYIGAVNSGQITFDPYAAAIYGNPSPTYIYGTYLNWNSLLDSFVNSTNATCSFSSSYTIYETQYKCTIRENEFNFTLNPSTISGSYDTGSNAGTTYGYVTKSYFSPYITTVGLYDEQQNLLAIGKLAQPLPSSPTTDTTIIINIDR